MRGALVRWKGPVFMSNRHREHHRHFPRPIARFLQLEGGQYGTVDLIALTPHHLEMQLGGDFVRFTRDQAADFRAAIELFLELGGERPPPSPMARDEEGEIVEDVQEEIIVQRPVVDEGPRSRRPRRPA